MYRLYTRIKDVHSFDQCLIALDFTPLDLRSNPSLNYYIQHWFIDVDDLIEFLLSTLNKRIILIVTNLLAKITCDILRPLFPQIIRIIIIGNCLCHEYEDVEYFSNAQSLVDHLSFVRRDRRRLYITFDSWPIERTSHDLTKHTAKYLWFSYFYTILSRLSNTNIAREEMLASIKVFHTKQTDIIKRSCEEFEQSYHSKDIFQWYTKSSFFYLLLNRTLRSEDINHIFAMRYVISDLENELIRQHCKQTHSSITTVYRGQQMYLNEIEEIKSNVGGLIGLTAFWSTTYLKRTAMNFTEIWPLGRVDSIESVLFTIQIPDHVQASVYLDISQLSAIGHELEVLFSFRSMFRVEQVTRNSHEKFWYVNLTLIDENDDQFVSLMSLWYSSTNNIIGDRLFFTLQNRQVQENVFRHLTLENRSFLSFQLLIDIMLRLEQNEYARSELVQVCRDNYQTNPIELNKIDEFERFYDPRDAIQWYTTDCFLYRLINRSLRIESIDCIFKLRYFIHDLHNQLARIQMEYLRLLPSNRRVLELYRGLRMRLHELQDLQRNKGNLVSTNTFLSTTNDYEAARSFSGDGNVEENFVSVIYRINVDTTVKHSIPFAQIDYQSIFKDEDEVLFSIGAVFRVGQCEQIRDRLWIIELTLTLIEDEQWNILTSHLHSRS